MSAKVPDADGRLLALMRALALGEGLEVRRVLERSPDLVRARISVGASAQTGEAFFLREIRHYIYAGDSALHIAAASWDWESTELLLRLGADCAAKNRRGAEALHYACDTNRKEQSSQSDTIACLGRAGADPNALDKSGVASLHRAVRTRGVAAVKAICALGADVRLKNGSGSTPLHLAVQNTGRGGTGSASAMESQKQIIRLLLEEGALLSDQDGSGKTVIEAARSPWIQQLLDSYCRS